MLAQYATPAPPRPLWLVLGDGARDVGAVPLVVAGVHGAVDEVEALQAAGAVEVGDAREVPVVFAGHAGVHHGHG